ncbi:MAG: type III pantothenate kinase [Candidatus Accumulibacter sp.]|uniref:type III pantothenate kinase n=1 Tax=Accumulibacter sp. TaxID=2053492 RepID=UPI001A102494|nr:type III pantothenate kinase [Accumulibacter sp.]MBE2258075.1 type III pantothenate kinase [Paracoccaceae bacterium]MCB1942320.1 type III pantothenate kinase [Accumulibacter sp.]MCP5246930.1 type III pantothenate kinase [Accumulibacter sp.]
MIVAIDAGNSRIKWALHDGRQWLDRGVLATAEVGRLAATASRWPANARAVVCNVAGAAVSEALSSVLAGRCAGAAFLQASAEACGVRSGYEMPGQLGADRWAALIGARAVLGNACVVVCAGTATTVDLLDGEGFFRGGLILPGFDLMRRALADNTAQLPLAEGVFRELPRNTVDAIISGCLQAQLGAVERLFRGIASEPGARCLLTGGAAPRLAAHLNIPFDLMDNLVLDGLLRFAASAAT